MSAKHTPGPWKKSERLNGPWWHISSAYSIGGSEAKSGRQAIACVHGESKRGATAYAEMFEANARLIAAAPELLEALLVAHKRITEDRASYVWGAELPDGSMDTKDAAILHEAYDSKLAQIEAAIAKATGGAV